MLVASVTLSSLIALIVTDNMVYGLISIELLALIFLYAFFKPETTITAVLLNTVALTWFWPESKHWLWICSILFNLIIIYELVS